MSIPLNAKPRPHMQMKLHIRRRKRLASVREISPALKAH